MGYLLESSFVESFNGRTLILFRLLLEGLPAAQSLSSVWRAVFFACCRGHWEDLLLGGKFKKLATRTAAVQD